MRARRRRAQQTLTGRHISAVCEEGLLAAPCPPGAGRRSHVPPAYPLSYALTLKSPVPAVGANATIKSVTYVLAACTIAIPYFQLACTLSQGDGDGLAWAISVDGVASVQPTTSYAPPVIVSMRVYNADNTFPTTDTFANTDGGSILRVAGTGFSSAARLSTGAVPLLNSVSLISPSGRETVMPRTSFTLCRTRALT